MRLYAQRQRLYQCAVQLLDDPHSARQIVAEAIEQALTSQQLEASPTPSDEALAQLLDELLLTLICARLKALPPPSGRQVGSRESWPSSEVASPSGKANPPESSAAPDGEINEAVGVESVTQLERTAQVVGALPVEARLAVLLVVMQGRSIANAARLLGTSEVSCRFFLSHGRKLMRRALQRDLIEDDSANSTDGLLVQPGAMNDLRRNKKAIARA